MNIICLMRAFMAKRCVLICLISLSFIYAMILPLNGFMEGINEENFLLILLLLVLFILRIPIYLLTILSIFSNASLTRNEHKQIRKIILILPSFLLLVAISLPYILPSQHTFTVYGEYYWAKKNLDIEGLHQWLLKQRFPHNVVIELAKDKSPVSLINIDEIFTPHIVNGVLDIRFIGHGMSMSTGGIAIADRKISVKDLITDPTFGLEHRTVVGLNVEEYALVWYGSERRE